MKTGPRLFSKGETAFKLLLGLTLFYFYPGRFEAKNSHYDFAFSRIQRWRQVLFPGISIIKPKFLMNRKINSLTAAAALGIFMLANAAFAQGTAFTYQGRLQNGTSLASGNYDLSFTLYTNSSGGSAVAGPVTNLAVAVSNGLFTTIVSFPGNPFTGTSNWLELAVRTNGAASFSPPLSPRQLMSAVPYAVFAETANAAGLTGQLSNTNLPAGVALLNANQTFTGSNVFGSGAGITGGAAITSSAASVPPGSSVDPSTFLHLYNTATDGNLSSSDVVGIGFGNNSTRQAIVGGSYGNDYLEFYTDGILTSPKMRIDAAGNVGIGTNNPTAPLEVNGNAKVDGALTAASFSGDGSGLTNLNIGAAPNLHQIALLKWHPYL